MSATLRLTREGFGVELRRGQFEISVDGKSVGSVKYGETVETPLEPGRHTLRLQVGRYSSRDRSFDAADSEIVSFRCHGAMVWPRYVASLAVPDLGISLKREREALGGHGRQAEVGSGPVVREGGDEAGTARTGQAARRLLSARAVPGAIEVSHLTKVFGGRIAVSDVSFSVAGGEVFGFLGPNGAGKTTMVRMLGTLISPTAGSAMVAGIAVGPEGAAEVRRRISVMPESPGLYLRLTVAENLEYFARLYGLPRRQARIAEALAATGLSGRAHDLAGSLSKGLRQRAALARSLLNEPAVMFLDEPTSGLDPVAAHEVHGLIAGLRDRGVTVFLTTHRLEEAERLCDRVAIMSTSLRTIGRPEDLRAGLFAAALEVTVAAALPEPGRVFGGLPAVQGWKQVGPAGGGPAGYVLTVSDAGRAAPAVTRALVAAGADVLSIAQSRHTLEDVYLELVGDPEGSPR